MNVFDIIGPVMVGPSSSHTAGAVRIGGMVRGILGEEPVEAVIKLHGSFAKTYQGHGTDKAIIAGLLGYGTDDLRIRNSLQLAEEKGLVFKFITANLGDVHPNTALIDVIGRSGKKLSVLGSSIGGGNIIIKQINVLTVEFTGQFHTLLVPHKDTPGVIASVTQALGTAEINIAQMKVFRPRRGGEAMMVIETDQPVGQKIVSVIEQLPGVIGATIIKRMS